MDPEKPHRITRSSKSELFVCFTSRMSSSSSSMKLLSPSRTRDPSPQISLSSSLSRRLRTNGSIKGAGQASPMFPTAVGKRRGAGFENPEPSSPKVTCIGQVRVKTKKQGKKMRAARSKRRSEANSFRKTGEGGGVSSSDLTRQNSSTSFQYQNKHRNQRWVHLPLTICEAVREFNCFFPCRSSCMRREKDEKGGGGEGSSSCGSAFGRWLHVVALQEGDEGKRREIEVVMAEEEEEEEEEEEKNNGGRSYRRHVFEDIEIDVKEENEGFVEEEEGEGEAKARVSICVPPKNALLLMRCRSDPVKMAALANRFWESPVHKVEQDEEDEVAEEEEEKEEDEEAEEENGGVVEEEQQQHQEDEEEQVEMEEDEEVQRDTAVAEESIRICEREEESEGFFSSEEQRKTEVMENLEAEIRTNPESSEAQEPNQVTEEEREENEDEDEEREKDEGGNANLQDESSSCVSNLEACSDLKEPDTEEAEEEKKENDESLELSSTPETLTASEPQYDEAATMAEDVSAEAEEEGSKEEEEEQQQNAITDTPAPLLLPVHEGPDPSNQPGLEERESGSNGEKREIQRDTLPECLLLMMCEPKLSMEVSKETWVCSTDFVRWLPERPAGKISGAGRKGAAEGRNGIDKKQSKAPPPPMQPPRSSCSFPAAAGMSMAAMIEQRLAAGPKSNGYEPFVLTRCKSEPMRSTAKLAADTCFWKKPHAQPATLGFEAPTGVGF